MNIPEEAVEAAAKASAKDEDASNWHDEPDYYRNGWRNRMEVGLEAAAPFIAAHAIEEAARGNTVTMTLETFNNFIREARAEGFYIADPKAKNPFGPTQRYEATA